MESGYAKLQFKSWLSQFRNGSNPWMARYVYGFMFLIANLLAWAVRDYGRNVLTEMESKNCSSLLLSFISCSTFLLTPLGCCCECEFRIKRMPWCERLFGCTRGSACQLGMLCILLCYAFLKFPAKKYQSLKGFNINAKLAISLFLTFCVTVR